MDIPLQNKTKRGQKKTPHCLSKPKQSTYRKDLPQYSIQKLCVKNLNNVIRYTQFKIIILYLNYFTN